MPETRFTLRVHLAGRAYRQEHEPKVPEARIVVSVHGRVTAQVAVATTASRAGTFVLHLEPPEGVEAEAVEESRASEAGLRVPVSAVCPGRYRALLRYVPTEEERSAGRAAETSEVEPVEVEAG